MASNIIQGWKDKFQALDTRLKIHDIDVTWVIVEGFLLYWHPVSSCSEIHLLANDVGRALSIYSMYGYF